MNEHIELKRKAADNRRLAQWRVTWFIEHSTPHHLLWCIENFSLQIPPLRQAPNRYVPFLNDNANRYRQTNEFT